MSRDCADCGALQIAQNVDRPGRVVLADRPPISRTEVGSRCAKSRTPAVQGDPRYPATALPPPDKADRVVLVMSVEKADGR
jgi:hypothetical protein